MILVGHLPGYVAKPPPRYRSGHLRLIVCAPPQPSKVFRLDEYRRKQTLNRIPRVAFLRVVK